MHTKSWNSKYASDRLKIKQLETTARKLIPVNEDKRVHKSTMLLACNEASTDNRCLEPKRTKVSVSTQVYNLQGRTRLYFSSFQKKNLCFTYDPPLYKLPFLCKRHSLSERKEENNEENELNPDFAKNEGGRVMEKEANPFFPHRPSGHWQKKTFGLHSPEILLGP